MQNIYEEELGNRHLMYAAAATAQHPQYQGGYMHRHQSFGGSV